MISRRLLVLSALAACLEAVDRSFPPHFKFGAVTDLVPDSWNSSDISTTAVVNATLPDPRIDIERVAQLGVNFYRFTVSWSRLMPNGFANKVSEEAMQYYNELVNGLRDKGVEPVVTLYQREIPARLQDLGGWANPLMTEWFAAYARAVFSLYGDRVKTWITINDPLIICDGGYSGLVAPGLHDPQLGSYLCSKNVLIAHAKAWRIYDEEFRPKYHGEISLSNQIIWYEPKRKSEQEMADLAMENCAGRYSHPIYSKEGGWPPALEQLIMKNSAREGYSQSRLPSFSKEEISLVKGTYDFYGVNHYTSRVVRVARAGELVGPWPLEGSTEIGIVLDTKPEWKPTTTWWFKQNPQGLRNVLVWLKEQYGDLKYLVTGNGYLVNSDADQNESQEQVQFYKDHLTQLLFAIKKDGVNVTGYTAWSHSGSSGNARISNSTESEDLDNPHNAGLSDDYYARVIKNRSLDVPPVTSASILGVWIALAAIVAIVITVAVIAKCYVKARKNRGVRPSEESPLQESTRLEKAVSDDQL